MKRGGPRKQRARVDAARESVQQLAEVEAARLREEAARPGTPPARRKALEAEAAKVALRAREWNAAMGTERANDDSLVELDVHAEGLHVTPVPGMPVPALDPTVAMPAPSWTPGHDGDGCDPVPAPSTATARTAEAVLHQLLVAPGDAERVRDRLAWAAAVILGQREMPDSEIIRAAVRSLEDAVLERVAQGAGGIVDWARREAPQAFKRVIDLARYSSSMKTKYQANMDIMAMGGIAPAKKIEITHKDALFERLSDDELDRYARFGEWPSRLNVVDVTPEE